MSTTSPTPPPESSQPPKPRWYSYWPTWRKLLMAGALILLAGSLVSAITDNGWVIRAVPNATFVIGYGLLAWGFWKAMRARGDEKNRTPRWTGETKDGWSPEESGKAPDDA